MSAKPRLGSCEPCYGSKTHEVDRKTWRRLKDAQGTWKASKSSDTRNFYIDGILMCQVTQEQVLAMKRRVVEVGGLAFEHTLKNFEIITRED